MTQLHTFVLHVEDKPGVLDRVASLFRRRAFNIESLTVKRTDRPGVSRMTVEVYTDDAGAQRLEAHLYKLINVLHINDVTLPEPHYPDKRDSAPIHIHAIAK
jgi:acetolactate synthase-1/3 small subunit